MSRPPNAPQYATSTVYNNGLIDFQDRMNAPALTPEQLYSMTSMTNIAPYTMQHPAMMPTPFPTAGPVVMGPPTEVQIQGKTYRIVESEAPAVSEPVAVKEKAPKELSAVEYNRRMEAKIQKALMSNSFNTPPKAKPVSKSPEPAHDTLKKMAKSLRKGKK